MARRRPSMKWFRPFLGHVADDGRAPLGMPPRAAGRALWDGVSFVDTRPEPSRENGVRWRRALRVVGAG